MVDFLTRSYYGNTVTTWLVALGLIVLSFIVGRVLYWLFGRWVKRLTRKTKTKLDDIIIDMVEEPFVVGVVLIGIYYAIGTLTIPQETVVLFSNAYNFLFALAITWMLVRLYDALHKNYLVRLAEKTETDLDDQLLPIFRTGIKFVIITLGVVIGLNNAGYDVATALAGLGIGGLAFALAAQDTVSNIFGGITILLQKPFSLGDRVEVGGTEGFIREVGLRSSTMKTVSGERILLPNKVFISESVTNKDTANFYPQAVTFHLYPGTSSEQVETIMQLITEIGTTYEHVVWALPFLTQVGEYSIEIQFWHGVKPWQPQDSFGDYLHKMIAVKSYLNQACLQLFEAHNVRMAWPILEGKFSIRPETDS
ncbi:MAG: mechanosensitive ion channel [Chloroflexi bacterium]|nr:mechanosensitive ion channel [Chloroflexota bacterium]